MYHKVAIIKYILKRTSMPRCFNHIQLFEILCTVSLQATCAWISQAKSPRDFPSAGIEPRSLTSPALAGIFFTTSATWDALNSNVCVC